MLNRLFLGKSFLASLLAIACAGAFAAERPFLRFYSGVSQPITPLSIAEDSSGYLWIAAEQGLFRFDGRRFDRIPGEFQRPTAVEILGGRNIFIAASNGLFQYRDGKVDRVSSEMCHRLVKPSDDFLFLLSGSFSNSHTDAAVWNGASLQVFHQGDRPVSMPFPTLSADGLLWTPCGTHQCSFEYRPEMRDAARRTELRKYWELEAKPLDWLAAESKIPIFASLPGGFYIGREENLAWIDIFRRAFPNGNRYQVGGFTRSEAWAPSEYQDRHGRVWIPGDYLWLFQDGKLRKFDAPQLDNKQVTCVFEDSRGALWFGLTAGGLAVMNQEPVLESWATNSAFGEINALTRQDASTLFAATYKGALYRKRGESAWEELNRGEDAAPISQIVGTSLNILLGFIRFGPPVRLDSNGKILDRINVDDKTALESFRRMVKSPDGTFYIGSQETHSRGLYRVDGDRLTVIPLPENGGLAQDIVFDRDGRGYVGFEGGVCRIDGDKCSSVIAPADGLITPKIRSVGVRRPDEIWVAYRDAKAFSRFRKVNGKWNARHFTEKAGYEWPETAFMHSDRRGWLWRGSVAGLFVSDGNHVEPEDWIRISDQEGLPSSVIGRFGFMEDTDGSVWIGTAAGIAHLHPSESWFTRGNSVKISSIVYAQNAYAERQLFPSSFPSPGKLTARFAGGSLLPIRYRLLPHDTAWRFNRTGEVQYDKLGAGHYQLQATTGQGNAIAEYPFDVTDPAGTRTRLAIAGGFCVVGFGLFAAVRRQRNRRMELERRALPDLSELRIAALVPEAKRLLGVPLNERFTPNSLLVKGTFASVFDGFDQVQNCRCAIKIFHRELADRGFSKRFRQEVSALETVSHPNVVRIYGHGSTALGVPYLVMEFVEGMTLRKALQTGGLPLRRAASLLRQAGRALAAIHAHAIFHRDLKPENLMIREVSAPNEDLVLIDFSIAIVKQADQTVQGLSRAAGTLQYMAPEQVMGYADAASDIYSLAKVTIEMITGKRLSELLPQAALDMPIRVRELLMPFPSPLSPASVELLSAALEFDPVRRPRDAAAFSARIAEDLESGG